MTAKDWIRDNYIKHGKLWVQENFNRFCVETNPKNENYNSYCSTLRIVEREIRLAHPELCSLRGPLADGAISADVSDIDQALDYHNIDLSRMKISGARVNTWGSETNRNQQVRLELKPVDGLSTEQLKQDFIDAIKDYLPPKLPNVKRSTGEYLVEMNITDAHWGQLSWGKETTQGDYDMVIADNLFRSTVQKMITWAKMYSPERILFPIGSDFFNSDNHLNTTTNGTPQTEDSRWQKTFAKGWRLVRDAIIMCREIADVDVVVVFGNHDHERSFYMGETLHAWFRDDKHVKIDNEPNIFKCYTYGKSMIGLTHGHKGKLNDLPLLYATDFPMEWALAKYREIHVGHLHNELTKEFRGCKLIQIPSIAAPSEWSASSSFRSMREAQSFAFHKDEGKMSTFYCRPDFI